MNNMFNFSDSKKSSLELFKKVIIGLVLLFVIGQIGVQAQTVTDIDGNVYNTVTIGTQVWMKENLKTTKYNDGTAIPNVTDNNAWVALSTGAYCDYDNTPANSTTYGRLYNWYAVDNNTATKVASNGGRNVCPTGWHVPSDTEWTTLENYLIANGYNYDGTTAENKIAKALASTTLWESHTQTGVVGNTDYPAKRNATGFTALPGGARNGVGDYWFWRISGCWWSSTEYGTKDAWYMEMEYAGADAHNGYDYKRFGSSVRCLKDITTEITNPSTPSIEIYPNPVSDILNIEYKDEEFKTVSILNSQGTVITNEIAVAPIQRFDFSKHVAGLYFLEFVKASGEIKRVKVIKH